MTTVSTTLGQVRGGGHGAGLRFAGIPFAAPPTGDGRWRPPTPAEPWSDVRDATEFGPVAVQNPDMMLAFLGLEPESMDEGCLHLNVFTPAADDARRPVMVWIHGGAFFMGSGSSPMYDGASLVERGDVVVVTVNYRLGALGFLELGWLDEDLAGSANVGLLDQVAALEWVRDNIAAFGGDPGNVTVFGESAGAMSVTSLLVMEAARGLFHKAIAQSGAAQTHATPAEAEAAGRRFVEALGVATADELRAQSVERLLEVQSQIVTAAMTHVEPLLEEGVSAGLPFRPVQDGGVLPSSVLAAIRAGGAAGVPVITGTTREEWRLFALMDFEAVDPEVLRRRLDALMGDGDKALAVYAEATAGMEPKDAFTVIATDLVFRHPAVQLGEALLAQGPDVWEYQLSWATPALYGMLGSCHALDLPFVFGATRQPQMAAFLGPEPPHHLADAIQDAWLSFARTGDPGGDWPRYDLARRAVRDFDAGLGILEDPGAPQREFWDSVAR